MLKILRENLQQGFTGLMRRGEDSAFDAPGQTPGGAEPLAGIVIVSRAVKIVRAGLDDRVQIRAGGARTPDVVASRKVRVETRNRLKGDRAAQ